MNLTSIASRFSQESDLPARPRPYINHSVEFKKHATASERSKILEKAGLNVFFFPSEFISGCDLLSDSGTTTMTNVQWAALHLGDETYGSNRGYFLLLEQVRKTFGKAFTSSFFFHQGRAVEDALFTQIATLGKSLMIPSNGHFDTTHANIEAHSIQALNLFSPELHHESASSFKGNMDVARLAALLKKDAKRIPMIFLTITNNTGGGQPVSMANIKEVSALAHDYNIPLFFTRADLRKTPGLSKTSKRALRKNP